MTGLIAKLLGIDRLETGQVEHWAVHWNNLDQPFNRLVFILALVGAGYAVWWFYSREPAHCRLGRKLCLAGLRMGGMLVLLTILAGPTLEMLKSGTSRNKVVILLDTSKSMSRQDDLTSDADRLVAARALGLIPLQETDADRIPAYSKQVLTSTSRLRLARAMLSHRGIGLLSGLAKTYDVEMWGFDRAADLLRLDQGPGGPDPRWLVGVDADGSVTEIGGALRATMNRLKGSPLAGIILISDGGNNKGEEPTVVAADLPVPVFPIGMGTPRARDVAIASVFMENRIFLDDPAPIYVRLRQHGFTGQEGSVRVLVDGAERERHTFVLRAAREQTETLHVKLDQPGKYAFRFELPVLPGESEAGNNAKERDVEVIDKKIKVLLVEGDPRWDYRYLRNALLRDPRVECSVLLRVPNMKDLVSPGSYYLAKFPERSELFTYDVVICGNVPNDAFWTEEDLANLTSFVTTQGGGLWFIAGRNHLPDTYRDSKLEPLIPVEFDAMPEVTAEHERKGSGAVEGFRVVPTAEGVAHPLLRLTEGGMDDPDENRALWDLVPRMFWHHKAHRPRPNATVLLTHGGGRKPVHAASRERPAPLLVVARVGRGKVLYSAVAELWRMRFPSELGPRALERFHLQAIQYLGLAHCLGRTPRAELNTDREAYALGDRVQVFAYILDPDTYKPSTAERVAADARDLTNDGLLASVELRAVPGQPGRFQGAFRADSEGRYRIALAEDDEETAYADILVKTPRAEMDSPEMNRELLENIAKASNRGEAAAEAQMYLPDQAGRIVDDLKRARPLPAVRIEDPLWDAPLMVILFALFLSIEWLVRKRSDLW